MAREKTTFFCTECGNEYPKWQGRCNYCGNWNTIVEQRKGTGKSNLYTGSFREPKKISEIDAIHENRFSTGMKEVDRVLGGGAVTGSLVLIGGAPGIGKSTLLLQICSTVSLNKKVLYVSGEESEIQLKMRAERLGANGGGLYVLSETDLEQIFSAVEKLQPELLIIDSIQTLHNEDATASPGSLTQVKNCTMALMKFAKTGKTTVFIVGHINKDGAIAGPKVLEHMVDCVLYFEGDRHMSYRILRAAKNRFGSTNEMGVFEMGQYGLTEVANPSEMLLAGRPKDAPGSCVACVMEGSRPVLAELQALLTQTNFGVPRRNANGFDYNRAMMLIAVLEKRGGMMTGNCDAYINVIGGLSIDEPAADLPMILAIASSLKDCPVPDDLVAIGETGLSGELRSVSFLQNRINEVARLGFKKCIIPEQNSDKLEIPDGLNLMKAKTVSVALDLAFR